MFIPLFYFFCNSVYIPLVASYLGSPVNPFAVTNYKYQYSFSEPTCPANALLYLLGQAHSTRHLSVGRYYFPCSTT